MTYQVTIERVPGFPETRETFEIRAATDREAHDCATTECRISGTFSKIIRVRRV